jgi:thiamine biosynthesis lipoprotein
MILLLALLLPPAQASVTPAPTVVEREIDAMGTRLELRVRSESRESALQASERAISAVQAAEDRLSTWRPESELSRVNRSRPGQAVAVSPLLARDLQQAFACAQETEGAFNPAIGPLVAAWDLRGTGTIPSPRELDQAVKESQPALFEIGPGKVVRKDAGAKIEEGGFGKGIGLDDAAGELKKSNVKEAMLDFGGQVLLMGGRETRVAIADPDRRDRVLLTLRTGDGSVSTSGNSEHGLNVGGRKVGHILNPKTGKPAAFAGSVTVIAPTGTEADCLSTGLFVMGPKTGLAWLRSQKSAGLEAIFVSRTKGAWLAQASCGLKGRLEPTVPSVKIIYDCTKEKT